MLSVTNFEGLWSKYCIYYMATYSTNLNNTDKLKMQNVVKSEFPSAVIFNHFVLTLFKEKLKVGPKGSDT